MVRRLKRSGPPPWIITFADLMAMLLCFFVLVISFSVPDDEKIKVVAGSIRDAFGMSREIAVTGMVEIDGRPSFRFARELQPVPLDRAIGRDDDQEDDEASGWRVLDEQSLAEIQQDLRRMEIEPMTDEERFDVVEESLARAVAQSPMLSALADNLQVEQVAEGLSIQLIDQAQQSMFPLASAAMYPQAQDLLALVVQAIQALPNRIWITGHTDALAFREINRYDNWSLSLDRANATRKVMAEAGLDMRRVAGVIGKADTELMVPNRPADPRNRRIGITLLRTTPRTQPDASAPGDRMVPGGG